MKRRPPANRPPQTLAPPGFVVLGIPKFPGSTHSVIARVSGKNRLLHHSSSSQRAQGSEPPIEGLPISRLPLGQHSLERPPFERVQTAVSGRHFPLLERVQMTARPDSSPAAAHLNAFKWPAAPRPSATTAGVGTGATVTLFYTHTPTGGTPMHPPK